MGLGLVMTIRNERALLRRNLLYHRFAGVDKVFLYLDRCTDGSPETVDDLPFVQIAPTTDPETLRDRPGAEVYVENPEQVTARQALNVIRALDLAAEEGLDWLMHIDADELVCPNAEAVDEGDLKRFFESVDDDVESVQFPPYEVCARRLEYEDVFTEETLFTPPDASGTRTLYNPIDGSSIKADLTLGHHKGKSAVRVGPDVIPRGPHEFLHLDHRKPNTITRGLLLHFYLHSFSQFVQKFRNMVDRPNTWIRGQPIRPQKRLWRDMVNSGNFDDDELRDYFERWVLVTDDEVRRRRRGLRVCGIPLAKPTLVEIPAARRTFDSIDDARAPDTGVEAQAGKELAHH